MNTLTDFEMNFHKLAREWQDEIGHCSFWHMMRRHPAAQQIVDMGPKVVPLILKKMRRDKSIFWSMLLCEITGTKPEYEPDKVAGGGFVAFDVDTFANTWLRWGVENGHLTQEDLQFTAKKKNKDSKREKK